MWQGVVCHEHVPLRREGQLSDRAVADAEIQLHGCFWSGAQQMANRRTDGAAATEHQHVAAVLSSDMVQCTGNAPDELRIRWHADGARHAIHPLP